MNYRISTSTTFIALHFHGDNSVAWVNITKIIYIYRNQIGSTFVCLGGEEESILVEETPEDILALIGGGNAK